MKNTLIKYLLLTVVTSSLSTIASAQVAKCSVSAGAITNSGDCYSDATTMAFPVTRVLLCKVKPTAPTLTTAVGNNSAPNCITFFSNASGAGVTAQKGTLQIGAGVTPQNQFLQNAGIGSGGSVTMGGGQSKGNSSVTFNYAYIESEPYVTVTAKANFNASKTGLDNSTGLTCWTTAATNYSWGTASSGSSCGSTANPLATKVMMNSLGTDNAYMSYSSTSNGITTDTYLVDSSLKLSPNSSSGSMGAVSKVINIQNLNVTINSQSGGLNLLVNISEGAWVNQSSVVSKLYFQNGNANVLASAR